MNIFKIILYIPAPFALMADSIIRIGSLKIEVNPTLMQKIKEQLSIVPDPYEILCTKAFIRDSVANTKLSGPCDDDWKQIARMILMIKTKAQSGTMPTYIRSPSLAKPIPWTDFVLVLFRFRD